MTTTTTTGGAASSPAPALPAATAVILRDGAGGIEVFMVVRHHAIDFSTGAMVFPGGKVDGHDGDPAWADLAPLTPPASERAFVVAAARETFEEAGLVLARRRGTHAMLDAEAAHALVERHRASVHAGRLAFLDLIRSANLELATDLMVPFAHWVTPEYQPKRFDTHFLLIAAPVEQLGSHDGSESVEGFWIRPEQALRDGEAGTRTLVFPTVMNLRKLARHRTVAEAVAAARASPVVRVMPRVERTPEGRTLHIPAEAGYGLTAFPVPRGRKG
jgi:8-oxo-dGTP pyrophosphatase MutT (NUDIX family)